MKLYKSSPSDVHVGVSDSSHSDSDKISLADATKLDNPAHRLEKVHPTSDPEYAIDWKFETSYDHRSEVDSRADRW